MSADLKDSIRICREAAEGADKKLMIYASVRPHHLFKILGALHNCVNDREVEAKEAWKVSAIEEGRRLEGQDSLTFDDWQKGRK